MMILRVILEGLVLGVLLILVCAIGMVGMAVISATLAAIMMLFMKI